MKVSHCPAKVPQLFQADRPVTESGGNARHSIHVLTFSLGSASQVISNVPLTFMDFSEKEELG